jgi:hypothetical protein
LLRGKRANDERDCSLRIEDSPQLAAESFNLIFEIILASAQNLFSTLLMLASLQAQQLELRAQQFAFVDASLR